jgi:hypothetical protein
VKEGPVPESELSPAARREIDRLLEDFQAVTVRDHPTDPEATVLVCGYFASETTFVERASYAVWPSGRKVQMLSPIPEELEANFYEDHPGVLMETAEQERRAEYAQDGETEYEDYE